MPPAFMPRRGASRSRIAATGLALCLALSACSKDPQQEIRERLATEMKQAGRGASDAEREQVADALAQDAVALGNDSAAVAAEQARQAAEFDTRYGTPEAAVARECDELQHTLERLEEIQRDPGAGEARSAEELAALPVELERIRTRQSELCTR